MSEIDAGAVAAWLAEIGYGIDFTTDAPLPESLRWPLARAYYDRDAARGLAGDETAHDHYDTLAEECGWTDPQEAHRP